MKRILADITRVLTKKEKKQLYFYTVAGVFTSLIDIASLAALIFTISIATGTARTTLIPSILIEYNAVFLLLIISLFFIIKNYFATVLLKNQLHYIYEVATRISHDNIENYLNGDYRRYVTTDSSVFIRKIHQHPAEFSQYMLLAIQQSFTEIVLIITSVAAIIIYNAQVFLFLLVFLLPIVLALSLLARKRVKTARENIAKNRDHSIQYLNEALKGYIEANIFGKKSFFTNRYIQKQQTIHRNIADIQFTQQVPGRIMETVAIAGLLLVVIANNLLGGTPGEIFVIIGVFMAAAYRLIPGTVKLINLITQLKTHHALLSDMMIPSSETPSNGEKLIDSISFDNLGFSFPDRSVFSGFTGKFERGDFAVIKSASGKGKTTMLNLMLGFLETHTGTICYNDIPVDKHTRTGFWHNISYVKQDSFLLNDTILKNIVLDSHHDDEKLQRILNITGLTDLINILPGGMEYHITENGKNFSGGQRQRIAISRALYKSADVYILDEPFNGLDKPSENRILEHFSKLALAGKIIIMISHNTDNLSCCNKVLHLHEN